MDAVVLSSFISKFEFISLSKWKSDKSAKVINPQGAPHKGGCHIPMFPKILSLCYPVPKIIYSALVFPVP